jgi:hypothetical protein
MGPPVFVFYSPKANIAKKWRRVKGEILMELRRTGLARCRRWKVMMNHYTPSQWVIGAMRLAGYFAWIGWLVRSAFFPRPEDKPKPYQLVIRKMAAIFFGVGLLVAIPYWLGVF